MAPLLHPPLDQPKEASLTPISDLIANRGFGETKNGGESSSPPNPKSEFRNPKSRLHSHSHAAHAAGHAAPTLVFGDPVIIASVVICVIRG